MVKLLLCFSFIFVSKLYYTIFMSPYNFHSYVKFLPFFLSLTDLNIPNLKVGYSENWTSDSKERGVQDLFMTFLGAELIGSKIYEHNLYFIWGGFIVRSLSVLYSKVNRKSRKLSDKDLFLELGKYYMFHML